MFDELSVQKQWPKLIENYELMKYMPDYKNSDFPKRDFLFEILSTMYPHETYETIKNAYKDRHMYYEEGDNEIVEIIQKIYDC